MSLTVHLKLCIPVPIECLIAEWRYRLKDFRLIDSDGNSLMFHKTLLQNISPKFDYLNKFCGEFGDGIEQMRLQTLGYYALQALYDLIYVGPLVTDEKRAWELCDQLQVLQLPLVTERRLESYINYKEVQLNNSYSDKEKNQYLPYTSTPNTSLTRRMILPTEDVELLNRHGSNVDEIQETSRTVRWFDLNEIQQRGTQIKRTTTDGLSCIKQASIQSKLKRKQDIALHRMTVTSMTSSLKSDGPSREVKELNKNKTDDKEKFLADFGLFCSPRPITRSLVKAIGVGSESLLPEKNKTLSPSKSPPKKSVPRSANLKYNSIIPVQKAKTTVNTTINQAITEQPPSGSSTNGSSRNTKSNTQVSKPINKSPCKNRYAALKGYAKTTDYSQLTRSNSSNNNRNSNSRGNEGNTKKCNGIGYKSSHKSSDVSATSNDEDTSDSSSISSSEYEEEDKTYESDDFNDAFAVDTKTKKKKRKTMSKEEIKKDLVRFKNQANKLRYIERKANAMKQIIQAITLALPAKSKFQRTHGYECFICGQLNSGSAWKDHILIKHYNMRFYCMKCGLDFKNVVARNKHTRDCSGI